MTGSRSLVVVSLLAAVLLFCGCATAAEPTSGTTDVESGHAGLTERVSRLNALTDKSSNYLIKLDLDLYTRLLRTAPRNYSVVVMLTSLNPRQNCKPCGFGYKEFEALAASWHQSPQYAAGKLFFAVAEFDSAHDIFEKLKLQSIPTIMHFPSAGAPKAHDTYKMQQLGLEAENMARFVSERTGININIIRPVDYTMYLLALAGIAVAAGIAYTILPTIVQTYNNPVVWAFAAVSICFVFSSGQMWNQIRGPAYIYTSPQSGQPILFHPQSQSQFGVESHIVMVLYALIAGSFLLLNTSAPYNSTVIKRRSAVYTCLAAFVFFLSVAFYVFRQKQRGYPFRLFF